MSTFIKNGVFSLNNPPRIKSCAAAAGKFEDDGPLQGCFDYVAPDSSLGEESWEKSEVILQKQALRKAINKGGYSESEITAVFAGDLQNQCIASAFTMRDFDIPFAGLYGACSTMAQALALSAVTADGADFSVPVNLAALTSSHFCAAERQFRSPLDYGGQRTPTSQRTATAAGCAIVTNIADGVSPFISSVAIGKTVDIGINDANNMGAAMAGAAYQTITNHLEALSLAPSDFDMIITGDLGAVGSALMSELFSRDGVTLGNHADCGVMLYDSQKQDVNAGGSGCGCSAAVMCGKIIPELMQSKLKKVLFAATGALMSPTIVQQGESIPGVSHSVVIEAQS